MKVVSREAVFAIVWASVLIAAIATMTALGPPLSLTKHHDDPQSDFSTGIWLVSVLCVPVLLWKLVGAIIDWRRARAWRTMDSLSDVLACGRNLIDLDELQAELGITIPSDDRGSIRTISDAFDYLERHPPP